MNAGCFRVNRMWVGTAGGWRNRWLEAACPRRGAATWTAGRPHLSSAAANQLSIGSRVSCFARVQGNAYIRKPLENVVGKCTRESSRAGGWACRKACTASHAPSTHWQAQQRVQWRHPLACSVQSNRHAYAIRQAAPEPTPLRSSAITSACSWPPSACCAICRLAMLCLMSAGRRVSARRWAQRGQGEGSGSGRQRGQEAQCRQAAQSGAAAAVVAAAALRTCANQSEPITPHLGWRSTAAPRPAGGARAGRAALHRGGQAGDGWGQGDDKALMAAAAVRAGQGNRLAQPGS